MPDLLRGVLICLEAAILEPRTQISGVVVIIDLRGLSLNHVWQFTPGFASMLLEWVQVKLNLIYISCVLQTTNLTLMLPYVIDRLYS